MATNIPPCLFLCFFFFFFVSGRRRHTRCYRDGSSDVCSSVLTANPTSGDVSAFLPIEQAVLAGEAARSEERRVGKEGRSRWSPYHYKKKHGGGGGEGGGEGGASKEKNKKAKTH